VISKSPSASIFGEIDRTLDELHTRNDPDQTLWYAAARLAMDQEKALAETIAPQHGTTITLTLKEHAPFVTAGNLSQSTSAAVLMQAATNSKQANFNAVDAVHHMSPALVTPLQNEFHELIGTILDGMNCKVANEALVVAIDNLCHVALPEIALSGLFLTLLSLPCLVGCVLCWMMYHYLSNLYHVSLNGSLVVLESDVEEAKAFPVKRSASNVEAGVDVFLPPPSFSWAPGGTNEIPNSRTVIFPGIF